MKHVELAVEPLRSAAVARAEQTAKDTIALHLEKLAAVGWDLNILAPYPKSGNRDYKNAVAYHHFILSITTYTQSTLRPGQPHIRKHCDANVARYVQICKDQAGAQYTAFVAKLTKKIGACDSAVLDGNHVWGYSHLTVSKAGVTEVWKTQQIVNVSVHGKLFNQWPSRKLK